MKRSPLISSNHVLIECSQQLLSRNMLQQDYSKCCCYYHLCTLLRHCYAHKIINVLISVCTSIHIYVNCHTFCTYCFSGAATNCKIRILNSKYFRLVTYLGLHVSPHCQKNHLHNMNDKIKKQNSLSDCFCLQLHFLVCCHLRQKSSYM